MKFFRILFMAVLAFVSLHAAARQVVQIVNYENVPIDVPGLSEAQVRNAIEGAARQREWDVRQIAPGKLLATLVVRGKHTVQVEIAYSPQTYSLTYRDSVNMKFTPGLGAGQIHPFYNRWVGELNQGIRIAVSKS